MKTLSGIISLLLLLFVVLSCESIDDSRIPATAVNIEIDDQGLWNTYGVHSYGEYRYFVKQEQQPSNFPYTALTYTGFGGVLLVSGYSNGNYNVPLAYDMACPVEARYNVRLRFDQQNLNAYCPKCNSRYDVCEGSGRPISGEALNKNYGLQRYRVVAASFGGYVIVR